jgi:hypothetical protein
MYCKVFKKGVKRLMKKKISSKIMKKCMAAAIQKKRERDITDIKQNQVKPSFARIQ